MSLIETLVVIVVFFMLTAYWIYNRFSEHRKRFGGYKKVIPEPYEMNKHNLII